MLGLAAIEANACGIPVVGFVGGGLDEAVAGGVTGILVKRCSNEYDNVTAIAQAIAACKGLSRSACREHAFRRFDYRRMTSEYARLFRTMLTGKAADAIPGVCAS
jgi:glycosyltransferase involved in cell wall biosynthesis